MVKERIIIDPKEELFREFRLIQAAQFEKDRLSKQLAEIRKQHRGLAQSIPERLRRLKL